MLWTWCQPYACGHYLICMLPYGFTTVRITLCGSSWSSGKRQMLKVEAEQDSSFKGAAASVLLHPSVSFAGCFPVVLNLFLALSTGLYLSLVRKLPVVASGSNTFWPLYLARNFSPIQITVIYFTLNTWNRIL